MFFWGVFLVPFVYKLIGKPYLEKESPSATQRSPMVVFTGIFILLTVLNSEAIFSFLSNDYFMEIKSQPYYFLSQTILYSIFFTGSFTGAIVAFFARLGALNKSNKE